MSQHVVTVNLKSDMPTVEVARQRLMSAIDEARRRGHRVIKLIHGYGSSGAGGSIKSAIHASLRKRRKDGRVCAFVAGERWNIADASTQIFIDAAPALARDRDLSSYNEGITIVLLADSAAPRASSPGGP